MPAITDKRQIFDKLHHLPAMPQVVREVMASFKDPNVGSAIMAQKIAHDQGLSARVLRVANSSFYGFSAIREHLVRPPGLLDKQFPGGDLYRSAGAMLGRRAADVVYRRSVP